MQSLERVLRFSLLAALACVTLAACPPPGGESVTLSGKVIQGDSGAAIAGATVYFSEHQATTAGDGSFSIALDKGEKGTFALNATGHVSIVIAGASCNASTSVIVKTMSATSGTTHSFGGKIYEYQTNGSSPTEILTGSTYALHVVTSAGGASGGATNVAWRSDYNSATTPSYSGVVSGYGPDCLVAAIVKPAGLQTFNVIQKADLSSASTTLDLSQDLAHTSAVTVTAEQAGNVGWVLFNSSYGLSPAANPDFSSSPSVSVNISNPYNYQYVAMQMKTVSNSPAGYNHIFMSTSTPAALGTSVTLPAIDNSLGPTAGADPASLTYASGTLSVASVAGALFYSFELHDNGTGAPLAQVVSNTPSITLPAWLSTALQGRSVKVIVMAIDYGVAWDVGSAAGLFAGGGVAPGVCFAMTDSMTGANYKVLPF